MPICVTARTCSAPSLSKGCRRAPKSFSFRLLTWMLLFSFWSGASQVVAQFAPPQVVSGSAVSATGPVISYSSTDRVEIGFADAGEVFHTNSGTGFMALENVSESVALSDQVAQAQGALLLVFIAYRESGEIFLVNNAGGAFGTAQALTSDLLEDQDPQLSVGGGGDLVVSWDRTGPGGVGQVVAWTSALGAIVVGEGSGARVAVRENGTALVAYLRGGQSYYRTLTPSGVLGAEELLVFQAGTHESIALAIDAAQVVHAAVRVDDEVLQTEDGGVGNFSAAALVVDRVDGDIALATGGASTLALATESAGIVSCWVSEGVGWVPLTIPGSSVGSDPDVEVDPSGYVHLVYEQGGLVFYTNTGIPPEASFLATPTVGELPLTVEFQNTSQEVISSVQWDFGDGMTSSAFSPAHTYLSQGPFTVTLTVSGPSGSSTVMEVDLIETTLPPNVMRIPNVPAFPGATVAHPVVANHVDDLQGFQIAFLYDDTRIDLNEIDFTGSITSSSEPPEFVFFEQNPNGLDSEALVAVVLDFFEPFDGRTIPAGVDHILASFVYEIDFPLATLDPIPFRFMDGLGTPPVDNVLAIDGGFAVAPFLIDGLVTVNALPQIIFKRGDANFDQVLDIGDPVSLLAYFFADGLDPVCPDSADGNDDGTLDLGDAIFLLAFLFNDGTSPSYPFPGFGLDPTEDTLGFCIP